MTEEFPGYNAMPKYVVSTTLDEKDLVTNWGETSILRSLDDVAALKQTEGGPVIIHGSAGLNRNLSDAGLIDRYHLFVFPVLLGAGKRLFSDTDKAKQQLSLVESESYSNGVQKLIYARSRGEAPDPQVAADRPDSFSSRLVSSGMRWALPVRPT